GSNCFTSYMKWMPTHVGAPESSSPKTPGLPEVGIISTLENPASRASCAMYSGPWEKLRFSAAMDGRAIQSSRRFTFSSWSLGIWLRTDWRSGLSAAAKAGIGKELMVTPASAPAMNSRRLKALSFDVVTGSPLEWAVALVPLDRA